jgi:hypothetical protein
MPTQWQQQVNFNGSLAPACGDSQSTCLNPKVSVFSDNPEMGHETKSKQIKLF